MSPSQISAVGSSAPALSRSIIRSFEVIVPKAVTTSPFSNTVSPLGTWTSLSRRTDTRVDPSGHATSRIDRPSAIEPGGIRNS